MAEHYHGHVAGPAVAKAREHYYREIVSDIGSHDPAARDTLGPVETEFIAQRDSFYIASISETQWPYLQHRGGPPGFLHVLDASHLAFADFRGNHQMLTTGNVAVNDRVSLFLMDYPGRSRLKILGHARVADARKDRALLMRLPDAKSREKAERLFLIEVVSFDWNCPKFITPRYSLREVEAATAGLRERIATLESELHEARHPKAKPS